MISGKPQIVGLEYKYELVGLRFYFNGASWDIDKPTLKSLSIPHFNISKRLVLKESGDVLITEEEELSGVLAHDASSDGVALARIKMLLSEEGYASQIRGFVLPWQISLQEFMVDESWKVVRVAPRTDEYKNQHELVQPDGTKWRYGWIGSGRDPYKVKQTFHKEQTSFAVFRGMTVPDAALSTYPMLQRVDSVLKKLLQNIRVSSSGEVSVRTQDGSVVTFPATDFPDARYAQRGFVTERGLLRTDLPNFEDSSFHPRELICISLCRALYGARGIRE